jgi:hypothetical protein
MPTNANIAPDFFDEDDDEFLSPGTVQGTRPNVPPPTYKVMGQDPARLPVPLPPQPLPDSAPRPRPQPTGTYAPIRQQTAPVPQFRPAREQRRTGPERLTLAERLPQNKLKLLLMGVGAVVVCAVLYLGISAGVKAWQTWQDDLTYGRPRTMQVDQFVGHNEQDGTPSHFIAQNNNRQITVIEYPGGDVTKTRVIPGPRLFGKDSELLPVKLRFEDVNGDNHVDMLLEVDNQMMIYINQDGNFRPITGEERAKIKLKSGDK